MPNLTPGTYPAFIDGYLRYVDAITVKEAIQKYSGAITNFFENVPITRVSYRYAEGKWNIKQMLQHIIDAERIFAYRALRIARHDKTPLAGFDEKSYAAAVDTDERTWEDLLQEFKAVRVSTDFLLKSFTKDQFHQSGTTNEEPNTVEALSFLIFSHILHHINIIKERYL